MEVLGLGNTNNIAYSSYAKVPEHQQVGVGIWMHSEANIENYYERFLVDRCLQAHQIHKLAKVIHKAGPAKHFFAKI